MAKAFAEQQVGADLRELALGVLLCEDLVAVIMLAVLTPLGAGAGLNAGALEWTGLRLGIFLLAIVGGGILADSATGAVGRADGQRRDDGRRQRRDLLWLRDGGRAGRLLGRAGRLPGRFAGGGVGRGRAPRPSWSAPLRDLFAAVFFVSVGMIIDPQLIVAHWHALALLVGVLIVGKTVGVTLGAMLAGTPAPLAVQTGLSLAQIGEFSFIIAGVGIQTGAAHNFLFSVAVAVSAITTFTTPFMIRACGPVGAMIERRAPHALARLQRVYDGWVERVNAGRCRSGWPPGRCGAGFFLVAGALCVAAVVIAVDIRRASDRESHNRPRDGGGARRDRGRPAGACRGGDRNGRDAFRRASAGGEARRPSCADAAAPRYRTGRGA